MMNVDEGAKRHNIRKSLTPDKKFFNSLPRKETYETSSDEENKLPNNKK